jgi:hypothetical protein
MNDARARLPDRPRGGERDRCADCALAEAEALSGWAVEFRYETDGEPPLDRGAALVHLA